MRYHFFSLCILLTLAISEMFSWGIVWVLFGIGTAIGSTCPDWVPFDGSSYCFNDNKKSWSNAKKTCQDFGGVLAVPNFKEEQEFIYQMLREHRKVDYYHGVWIDCSLIDGEWVYSDSTPCEYNDWGLLQPDDSGSCAILTGLITMNYWKASSCDDLKFSICESMTESAVTHHQSPATVWLQTDTNESAVTHHQSSATVWLQADTNGRFASPCLTGHVIKDLPIKGVVACGSACRDEPRCRSFNVRLGDSEKQICQLNDVTREEADKGDIEMDNSCYYFDI